MPTFAPDQLAAWTGGRWTVSPTAPLAAFHFDSREIGPGNVFVAIKTEKRDGHDFLAAAQRAGASAALVAQVDASIALPQLVVADPLRAFQAIAREHRRRFTGRVVGISGSAGKTSTKDLLALLLGGASCGVVATEGNLNNHLGVPLTLTRLDPATHKFAVIEAGISSPGEMKVLADMIEPDVSLITLVAAAHTEELGGIEGVAGEKAVLPEATRPSGIAVFSKETAAFSAFRALEVETMIVERADVVRPSEPPKNKVFFAVSHRGDQTAVSLAYGNPPPKMFILRRVSDGMAQNAALAICTALWLGIPIAAIQARLAGWQPAKLRGEIRQIDGRLVYLDCYNANPASMADALATFESIASSDEPRLFVLGCMEELGTEAAAHHRQLGRTVRIGKSDRVFIIGTHAHEISAGLLEADASRQVDVVSSLEPVATFFAKWPHAVFVKGSRRYQLEKILEVPAASALPS